MTALIKNRVINILVIFSCLFVWYSYRWNFRVIHAFIIVEVTLKSGSTNYTSSITMWSGHCLSRKPHLLLLYIQIFANIFNLKFILFFTDYKKTENIIKSKDFDFLFSFYELLIHVLPLFFNWVIYIFLIYLYEIFIYWL